MNKPIDTPKSEAISFVEIKEFLGKYFLTIRFRTNQRYEYTYIITDPRVWAEIKNAIDNQGSGLNSLMVELIKSGKVPKPHKRSLLGGC